MTTSRNDAPTEDQVRQSVKELIAYQLRELIESQIKKLGQSGFDVRYPFLDDIIKDNRYFGDAKAAMDTVVQEYTAAGWTVKVHEELRTSESSSFRTFELSFR